MAVVKGHYMTELFTYQKANGSRQQSVIHSSPFFELSEYTISSPVIGDIPAYLIRPNGAGPFPFLLFLHPAVHTKDYFLNDAMKLAKLGFGSLLIDAPMARPQPGGKVGSLADPEGERAVYRQTVIDLRQSIDFLETLDFVDPERIGFVGQNFGAALGAVLAGVENRVKAYVLIAGIPNLARFWTQSDRPVAVRARGSYSDSQLAAYLEATKEFAATNFIGKANPSSVLLQFGKHDSWITKGMAIQFYDAASAPKKLRFYETDHAFDCPEARQDYVEWLGEKLNINTEN